MGSSKKKDDAAAKKRSAAAKKAAATRKANQEEQEAADTQATESTENPEYQPKHQSLQAAGLDHHAAEEERQAELAAERDVHNERTGDVSR